MSVNGIKANPASRKEIQAYARYIKKVVGLENVLYFPILQFVENVIPKIFPEFQFEIVPVYEMNEHGLTYPSSKIMKIREDVYEGAAIGEGRDRYTVAHETGHLFMHDNDSIALCRLEFPNSMRLYENPEWQADVFGGELLASTYLIRGMTEVDVHNKCGVSWAAARTQLKYC